MAKNEQQVSIPAINISTISFRVIGTSPLIMHRWPDKVKKEMLDKQMGKASTKGRPAKNPVQDFITSAYWLAGEPTEYTEEAFAEAMDSGKARFGFPAVAFKSAAVSAGYRAKVVKDKVSTMAAFHIIGDMVEIKGAPRPREDMVRVANGAPDIRYRAEFPEWEAEITVRFNSGAISAEQIINLFNLGGFAVGVGEWRVEKGGSYGMFSVA